MITLHGIMAAVQYHITPFLLLNKSFMNADMTLFQNNCIKLGYNSYVKPKVKVLHGIYTLSYQLLTLTAK